MSPTILFSRQFSTDRCRNLSNDIAYKPTTPTENPSKTQQLPDLVKESSILKSKTAPNICGESSIKDKELIDKPGFLHQTNNLTKDSVEDMKNSQNTEKLLLSNTEESNGFRPRSPLHETSIVVPQVDWNKKNEDKEASSGDSEIDSDSLSSSDSNEAVENDEFVAINLSPPRLQIHSTDGDLLLDERVDRYKPLGYDPDDQTFEPDSIEVSFLQDHRLIDSSNIDLSVDNARTIETLNNNMEQLDLRDNKKDCSSSSEASAMSNKQDDSEENDITTAAFTETEFSEWARDGEALVSDDLRDVEFDIDPNFITIRRNNAKLTSTPVRIAKEEDTELDYSKIDRLIDQKYPNNSTSKLLVNGEDINYMDTDNESLLDDSLQDASNIAMLRNRGYIEFVNVKTILPDVPSSNLSIADAPIAKLDLENDSYSEEEEGFKDSNVIEIDPITMEDVINKLNEPVMNKSSIKSEIQITGQQGEEQSEEKFEENTTQEPLVEAINKELFQSMEEDSLFVMEQAEDTTTSEVVTILASPVNPQVSIVPLEVTEKRDEPGKADLNNPDYLEYVKRLQFRIAEFSNAKDSIDVRKSKRKNSKGMAQSAEMIAEEIKSQETTTANSSINSPATSRKLEEITRERSKQKNVIQDLLMDKVEAHKQKSAEKKARRAARTSSFTTMLSPMKQESSNVSSTGNKFVPASIISTNSPVGTTSDEANKLLDSSVSSRSHEQCDQVETKEQIPKKTDQLNELQMTDKKPTSLEDIFKTPIAPPRFKSEEARRTAEKARQDARERARMKSDEDLGLSPEDRIKELRMKVTRRQLSMDDTRSEDTSEIERAKSSYFSATDSSKLKLQTSKSTDNMKNIAKRINFQKLPAASAKSMDELLNTAGLSCSDNSAIIKRDKKKPKDSERRKSIIQAVSDFFFKKETTPSPSQKDKLSMFRLTSKSKGKVSI